MVAYLAGASRDRRAYWVPKREAAEDDHWRKVTPGRAVVLLRCDAVVGLVREGKSQSSLGRVEVWAH